MEMGAHIAPIQYPGPPIVSQAPCAPQRIHSDALVFAEHSKAITSITFTGLTDTAGWLRVLVLSHTQPRSPNWEHVARPIFSCPSGTGPTYKSQLLHIFHLGVFLHTMAGKSFVWQCGGRVRLTIAANVSASYLKRRFWSRTLNSMLWMRVLCFCVCLLGRNESKGLRFSPQTTAKTHTAIAKYTLTHWPFIVVQLSLSFPLQPSPLLRCSYVTPCRSCYSVSNHILRSPERGCPLLCLCLYFPVQPFEEQ